MFVYRITHVTYFMYVGMYFMYVGMYVYFVMLLECMYMYCAYRFYMALLESIHQLEG